MLKEHHPPVFPTQFSGGQSILYVPFVWPAVKSGKMGAWHENWQSPKTQQPKNKKKSAAAERKFYATRIPKNAKIGAAKIKVKGRERWALVRRSGRGPCENSHEIVVLCVVGGLIRGSSKKEPPTWLRESIDCWQPF